MKDEVEVTRGIEVPLQNAPEVVVTEVAVWG